MGHTIVKTDNFNNLIWACEKLSSQYRTFCPTIEDDVEDYRPLDQMHEEQCQVIEELAFRNKPPLGSIKSFLFPDSETYIKFTKKGNKLEVEELEGMTPQIILGAKPCDIKSLELIDKVFLADPVDTLYQEKREKTLLITAICPEMGHNCSCIEFDVSPLSPKADILMTRTNQKEKTVYMKAKGEQFIQQLLTLENFLITDHFPVVEEEVETEKLSPEIIQKRMDELFDSPLWEELAMLCIGCGTCTYYCPTCHCYDIRDFHRKEQGVRYRTWDSCMFANFTNMAGGHNPRPTRKDRIQNRFFHKLNYFVKKEGNLACVGCGRCAELCPVGISINTVLKKIGGDLNG
mgnify:FL=1